MHNSHWARIEGSETPRTELLWHRCVNILRPDSWFTHLIVLVFPRLILKSIGIIHLQLWNKKSKNKNLEVKDSTSLQFICDNMDNNSCTIDGQCTIDGHGTFHGMGIIAGLNSRLQMWPCNTMCLTFQRVHSCTRIYWSEVLQAAIIVYQRTVPRSKTTRHHWWVLERCFLMWCHLAILQPSYSLVWIYADVPRGASSREVIDCFLSHGRPSCKWYVLRV